MPFRECSRVDARAELVRLVREEGVSVAEAARRSGVSRTSAHLWLGRAERGEGLKDRSRAPLRSPSRAPEGVREAALALKAQRPGWGGRKIHAALWPEGRAPVCARTVERILAREGLTAPPAPRAPETGRFESAEANHTWQMDFKGLGERPPPYRVLSVLDDATRYLVALRALADATWRGVFAALWEAFAEHGLPERFLTDNGDCFNSVRSLGPTALQARLWRLGVATAHGRPRHPQTQGKVERFHRTLELEAGAGVLRRADPREADRRLRAYREDYNWARPHEALGGSVPAERYRPSPRGRPDELPPPAFPDGAVVRRVGRDGRFSYRGRVYRASHGLAEEPVGLREEGEGVAVYYANVRFALLHQLGA